MQITGNELIQFFQHNKGSFIAAVTIRTYPKMRKTDNPYFGDVVKFTTYRCSIGFDYETSVNRQRCREDKEETFISGSLSWGQHMKRMDDTLSPVIEHNGTHYLQMKVNRVDRVEYTRLNGEPIDVECLRPFLYESDATNQGVDQPVVVRTPKLESILSVRMLGQVLELVS